MSDFDKAIEVVLNHEGGFVDDEDDVGGATNYGISLTYLERENYAYEIIDQIDFNKNNYIDSEDIRNMPLDVAKHIYRVCWWEKYGYENIKNEELATKVFDIAVNVGPYRCHLILQKSINGLTDGGDAIAEDGLIGPITIKVTNSLCPGALIAEFKDEAAGFYRELCRKNSSRMKYLKGWLNRVYS